MQHKVESHLTFAGHLTFLDILVWDKTFGAGHKGWESFSSPRSHRNL